MVIACVDIVFTHQTQVLLAKRDRPPRADWWLIGGRMIAGEIPVEAVLRKAAEEAQMAQLTADRCRWLGVYSTCFANRHQPPQEHGLHSLNLVYSIELNPVEKAAIALDPEEYNTWQWIEPQQISRLLDRNKAMDLALLSIIRDWELSRPQL
ncbi:MAG: NUDIX hydrolase [Leptolyngbyaceae cyanobacterium CRU_2_3]|nr:NUDIX hydrolase [Leptolyngbyaceae cyanobacterium CRU_2_3]